MYTLSKKADRIRNGYFSYDGHLTINSFERNGTKKYGYCKCKFIGKGWLTIIFKLFNNDNCALINFGNTIPYLGLSL